MDLFYYVHSPSTARNRKIDIVKRHGMKLVDIISASLSKYTEDDD